MGTLLESARKITVARLKDSLTPRVVGTFLEELARAIETLQTTGVGGGGSGDTTLKVRYFTNYYLINGDNTITHNENMPTIGVYVEVDGLWTPFGYSTNISDPLNKTDFAYMCLTAGESRNIKLLLGTY